MVEIVFAWHFATVCVWHVQKWSLWKSDERSVWSDCLLYNSASPHPCCCWWLLVGPHQESCCWLAYIWLITTAFWLVSISYNILPQMMIWTLHNWRADQSESSSDDPDLGQLYRHGQASSANSYRGEAMHCHTICSHSRQTLSDCQRDHSWGYCTQMAVKLWAEMILAIDHSHQAQTTEFWNNSFMIYTIIICQFFENSVISKRSEFKKLILLSTYHGNQHSCQTFHHNLVAGCQVAWISLEM